MKIPREKIKYVIGGALFAVLAVLYLLVYMPLAVSLGRVHSEYKICDTRLKKAQSVISGAKSMDTNKILITDRALITEEGISNAVADLTANKELYDIDFISITPGEMEKQADPRYQIMPIEFKIESDYKTLGEFLGLLDDLERAIITIREFTAVPDQYNRERLKTDLVLNIYISGEYGK